MERYLNTNIEHSRLMRTEHLKGLFAMPTARPETQGDTDEMNCHSNKLRNFFAKCHYFFTRGFTNLSWIQGLNRGPRPGHCAEERE